ncbi:MAG TPA: hypothetical protein PLA03_03915 [Acidobacteriota bacterium]|nr:hypothetical protein [Acidobacteriota bacterium]HNT18016.1 hypothetical protein [Acidobacteriota bacterium]HQO19489.1 hypothetical protein [Acidobacteriota bacterium]
MGYNEKIVFLLDFRNLPLFGYVRLHLRELFFIELDGIAMGSRFSKFFPFLDFQPIGHFVVLAFRIRTEVLWCQHLRSLFGFRPAVGVEPLVVRVPVMDKPVGQHGAGQALCYQIRVVIQRGEQFV